MKSCTKKSRKYTRRSAVASLLVLSSCFGAAQAYAGDYNPNEKTVASGDNTIPSQTVNLSSGSYGTIWGSSATVTGNGTATTGGNKVTVTDTEGAVVGSYSFAGSGGTAKANDNEVHVKNGYHANMRGGWGKTSGACTNVSNGNKLYLTDATIGSGWMSTGDASSYDSGAADVDSNGNYLEVSGGSTDDQYVGGYSGNYTVAGGTADTNNNEISLSNATAPTVKAGWARITQGSGDSNAKENTLTISGANASVTNAYSGYAYTNGTASGGNVNAYHNTSTIKESAKITGVFSGGYAETAGSGTVSADKNVSTVNNATVTTFSGGTATTTGSGAAEANENENTIENSAKITTFSGGSAEGKGNATAKLNNNTVDNATVETFSGGSAKTNGNSTATAQENINNIKNNATITKFIGGAAETDTTGTARAYKNNNTVDSATVTTFIGGSAEIGTTGNATADENSNTLTSATVTNFTGGYAKTGTSGTAKAYNNTSTITKGSVQNIVGGYAEASSTADASKNTTTVTNNTAANATFASGHAKALTNNTVTSNENTGTIDGGTYSSVRGGWADLSNGSSGGSGTTQKNTLNLTNVTITGDFSAAADTTNYTSGTKATLISNENTVNMSGGSVQKLLYAGHSMNYGNGDATASSNTFNLKEGADVVDLRAGNAHTESGAATTSKNHVVSLDSKGGDFTDVYGGHAETSNGAATANENEIKLDSVKISQTLTGGYADTTKGAATASENYGTITNATVSGDFYGGIATGTTGATTYKNVYTLDKGSYQKVQGGRAYTTEKEASATYNKVTFSNNVTVGGTINGGSAESKGTKATASNNTVEALTGVTLTNHIRVGEAKSTATAYANNNTANIKDGTSSSYVVGGYSNLSGDTATYAEAKDNVVTVNGTTGEMKGIYGGEIQIAGAGDGLSEHNTGTLTGLTVTNFAGGTVYNQSGTVTATKNEFTISKGTYTYMYGGVAQVQKGAASTDNAKATSNKIDMSEGSITGAAYGGRAEVKEETAGTDTATADSNTLNLNKTTTDQASWLVGGYATVAGTGTATATDNNGTWTDVKYTKDDLSAGGYASVKSGSSTASTNKFTLSGGSYTTFIGGKAQVTAGTNVSTDKAVVSGNEATLKGGTSTKDFTGGYAVVAGTGTAQATNNKATFDNVTATSGTFRAAYATTGKGKAEATGNTATVMTSGTYNYVAGGEAEVSTGSTSDTATASSNKVVFDNATLAANATVFGGLANVAGASTATATVTANNNTLHIAQASGASNKAGNIFGGYAEVESTKDGHTLSASTNGIEITNGSYTKIYGGHALLTGKGTAVASNNGANTAASHVGTLKDVTADQFVGGLAEVGGTSATASRNIFTMTNGTYNNAIGGQAKITNGTGVTTDTATAKENQITLTGGTSSTGFTGAIAQVTGTGTAKATDNKATLDKATSNGTLTAASATVDKGIAEASSNTATVKNGGTYKNLTGGEAAVNAGGTASDSATASSNKVVFDSATLAADATVYGGKAFVIGDSTQTATSKAEKNALHIAQISGASNKVGNVFGGYASVEKTKDGSTLAASINGVDITNGTYTNIYGGHAVLTGQGSATASNNGEYEEGDISHVGTLKDVTAEQFAGGLASVTGGTAAASKNIFTLDGGKYTEAAVGGQASVENGTQKSDTATASGNELTLKTGAESSKLFTGGRATITGEGTALAESNKAIVISAKSTDSITAGTATSDKGDAKALSNATSLTGGEYTSVFGGQAHVTTGGTEYDAAEASKNSVVIEGGATASKLILGGYASLQGTDVADRTSAADKNTLKVTQTGTTGTAYGGRADVLAGAEGTLVKSNVSASTNGIEFDGGTYTDGIYGGYAVLNGSGTATASNNGEYEEGDISHVGLLKNVTTDKFVGGLASVVVENNTASSATASKNIFTLDGGKYNELAIGGQAYVKNGTQQSDTATASGNELTLQNGAESTELFTGGIAIITGEGTALAESNKAIINSAKSTNSITAGTATSEQGEAKALLNETSLTGGEYTSVFGGQAHVTTGGTEYDAAEASQNTVVIDGEATASKLILGGYASLQGTDVANRTSTADKNTLKVTQTGTGTTEIAYGGRADVLAREDGTIAASIVSASDNGIEFTGGTYTSIYGGYAMLNGSGTATASNNGGIASDVTDEDGTETDKETTGTGSDTGTSTETGTGTSTDTGTGAETESKEGSASDDKTTATNELVLFANEAVPSVIDESPDTTDPTGPTESTDPSDPADDSGTSDGDDSKKTAVGILTNVTTDRFTGGMASVASGTSTAQSNIFTFEEGSSKNAVGGQAQITAGTSEEDVALATENKLVLNKGTSKESFTGGVALVKGTGTARVSENAVELTEATSESGTVVGATASAEGGVSDAQENTVTIDGGTFNIVNAAQSITGNGSSQSLLNVTTMTNAESTGTVIGGSSAIVNGTSLAQDNKVMLTGGTYTNLIGGQAAVLSSYPATEEADDEAPEITEAEAVSVLSEEPVLLTNAGTPAVASESNSLTAEGSGGTGTVTGNEVCVTDGIVTGVTIGGLATADASGTARALSNTVKLKESGEGSASYSGTVFGARAVVAENGTAEVSEASTIELDSGSFDTIYGGSAEVAGSGTATATGQVYEFDFTTQSYSGSLVAGNASAGNGQAEASSNGLTLSGVYTGNVLAGQAAVTNAGSASDSASAKDNSITINDAVVYGELHSGFAYVNGNGTGTVSGNEIVLNGGQYASNISAGLIWTTNAATAATATDNTMVLALGSDGISSPVFNAQQTVLYGGYATTDGTTSIHTTASNNTMRYEYVKGMTAANIKGFTNLDFTLPDICAEETILTLTGGEKGEKTSIANATAKATVGKVYGKTGGTLQIWDKVYLLTNAKGIDSKGLTKLPVEYAKGPVISRKGMFITEGLLMKTDKNNLYLTTEDPDMDRSGAKAISEGAAAGLALASEAADSVIELMRSVGRNEWLVFGRISGGKSRYETGSSIDMTTLSMVAGVGRGINTDAGFLTVGGFLEYGTGSYTTHNSFAKRSDVDGDGQSKYMGGGLMAKMDFKDTGPGHFYADATAHMGNLHTAFDSNDLTDVNGRVTTFDYDTPYYSIHGTLGYQWNITDNHDLDLYGQYIWTKVEGANVDMSTGDIYQFDDMNSNRLRLGATYSYTGHPMFSPYIGAAWEHEFSGKCESTSYGFDVEAPSFRGDTFRGELGIKTIESEDMPVTLNLGVQGFTGVRNGISGSFYFRYDF